jgi:hypothetical protein
MILQRVRFRLLVGTLAALLAATLPPTLSVGGLRAQSPAAAAADQVPATPDPAGEHLRLVSPRGIIHVWRPEAYNARSASIVVYVHGYFTSVDQAWADDRLAEQFQGSGRNALFIAPEAPASLRDRIPWRNLRTLLRTVGQQTGMRLPAGPIVVVGHSGAFRTIVNWLPEPRLRCVLLLDGLYRDERQFRSWLRYAPAHESHRLVLVADETARESERFARRFPTAHRRDRIPDDLGELTPQEKRARLLVLRSQYEHMQIVTSGRVIPLLLGLAPLPALVTASQSAGADSGAWQN